MSQKSKRYEVGDKVLFVDDPMQLPDPYSVGRTRVLPEYFNKILTVVDVHHYDSYSVYRLSKKDGGNPIRSGWWFCGTWLVPAKVPVDLIYKV